MPIYEYRCSVCRHQFDVLQKMTDPPVSKCERCGKKVTRVISSSGLVFKGSGWYVTDYGTRKKQEPADTSKKTTQGAEAPAPADTAKTSSDSAASPSVTPKDKPPKDKKDKKASAP